MFPISEEFKRKTWKGAAAPDIPEAGALVRLPQRSKSTRFLLSLSALSGPTRDWTGLAHTREDRLPD